MTVETAQHQPLLVGPDAQAEHISSVARKLQVDEAPTRTPFLH